MGVCLPSKLSIRMRKYLEVFYVLSFKTTSLFEFNDVEKCHHCGAAAAVLKRLNPSLKVYCNPRGLQNSSAGAFALLVKV